MQKELFSYMEEHNLNIYDANELIEDAISENGIEELLEFIYGPDQDYIRKLAIGLTQYCFRSGPIEDMHAGIHPKNATEDTDPKDISQLSQEDMKTLNKYMVDKLGFLLHLLFEGRYLELGFILGLIKSGSDWDSPDIEKEEKEFMEIIKIMK